MVVTSADLVEELALRAKTLVGTGTAPGAVAGRLAGVRYRVVTTRRLHRGAAVLASGLLAAGVAAVRAFVG